MEIKFTTQIKLFVWQVVCYIFPTRGKLRDFAMEVEGECPYLNKEKATMNYIFMNFDLAFNVWSTIDCYCLIPINMNLHIADYMEYIWTHKNLYNKIFQNSL